MNSLRQDLAQIAEVAVLGSEIDLTSRRRALPVDTITGLANHD